MKSPIPANLESALRASYIYPFQCRSSYPECDAPQNLRGRTHYVDEDTLRGFKSRILDAGMHAKGIPSYQLSDSLVYWLVESVNSRPDHGGKNKRFVAFDIFGTVISDRVSLHGEADYGWFRTSADARAAGLAFLEKFDAVKHTRDELKARAKRQIAEAKATLALLRKPRKTATPAA